MFNLKLICMKLKLFYLCCVTVVSVSLFYTLKQEKSGLSTLTMENVEAIARGESDNFECIPPYDTYTCVYMGSVRLPGIKYNL
jgi:hypothetical protein